MANQRGANVRRLADAVAELPSCCVGCDYLEACSAHPIACMDFVGWCSDGRSRNENRDARIATREVFELAFSGIPATPECPRVDDILRDMEEMLVDSLEGSEDPAWSARRQDQLRRLRSLRSYLADMRDVCEFVDLHRSAVRGRAMDSVRAAKVALARKGGV